MDFYKPLLPWYWILMVSVLFALIRAVADGLNRDFPLSRTSRFIRVGLGGLWAILIIVGMAFERLEGLSLNTRYRARILSVRKSGYGHFRNPFTP